ncbi:DnaT-like ssDNA-binding protein [Yersinia enterocolitica]|uniref:DnaT-like ssDNA-binding protein n=1 Tax=Yersinia enterocolitica TaxID=630 RepID=UPI00398D6165
MLVTDLTSDAFNSYASVIDLREYAGSRGYQIPYHNEECEKLLIIAMDYLEGLSWKGTRTVLTQPLAWPRSGVIFEGHFLPANEIPHKVIQAQCRLAIEAQQIDLAPSFEGGAQVIQETVTGAVSVSYAEGTATSRPKFTWLDGMLRGLSLSTHSIKLVRG